MPSTRLTEPSATTPTRLPVLMGLHIPDSSVPAWFRRLVTSEISAAERRINELMPLTPRTKKRSDGRVSNFTYTEKELIDAIQRFHHEHGRVPISRDFRVSDRDNRRPAFLTYVMRFGSWSNAIELAGFPRPSRGRPRKRLN